MKDVFNIKNVVVILAFIAMSIFSIHSCVETNKAKNATKEFKSLNVAAEDTLKKVRNLLDQEISTTSVLKVSNAQTLLALQSSRNDVQQLQKIVRDAIADKKTLSTALYLANTTIIELSDSFHNHIVRVDTVNHIGYPVYSKTFSDKDHWIFGNIKMGLDTFKFDGKFRNEYEITIGDKKTGLFSHQQFAEIKNRNPYTTTDAMKVFEDKPKVKSTIKPFVWGVGIGATTVLVLKLLLK